MNQTISYTPQPSNLLYSFDIQPSAIYDLTVNVANFKLIRVRQDFTVTSYMGELKEFVIVHREPPGRGAIEGNPAFWAFCTRAISRRFLISS